MQSVAIIEGIQGGMDIRTKENPLIAAQIHLDLVLANIKKTA